ncbi:MAG TPA: hypothetical protein VE710_18180 [Candidatus Bathyarchaeia archaeon]|nr:hypothetical protein [Candidatus Bathyarchaeia archaeon]
MIEVSVGFACWVESFLLPLDTTSENQHVKVVFRNNRRLPVGHRVRGDVL